MRRNLFRRFLRGSWSKIAILSALGGATSFCGVYLALLSKQVVDIATGQSQGSLLTCGVWLALLIFFQLLLQVFLNMLDVRIVVPMRFRIQSRLFEECLHKQKLAANQFHSGELVNRIAGDTSIVAEGVVSLIPSLVSIGARIVFSFCALLMLDPVLAVLCVLAGILMLIAAQFYRKRAGVLYQKSREAEGKIRSFIQETVQNLVVIKAFSAHSVVRRQLGYAQDDAYALAIRKNQLGIIAHICFYVAMTAGYYLALGWGAWRLLHGTMSFGTLTAILTLTGEVAKPFQNLASLFTQYISVSTSVERLEELEALPEDAVSEPIDPAKLYRELTEISISNVSFSYG
ncbi:MAG: ABC transporter ATP-binding protein, partial [Clostridia bacterium]|nr:ABC transporter ATP-binding protein [Clostridia bacterium]